uniref:CHK kinase-like domain-containing protein n=1 Tax=Anopheles dirus TaxID=7168 RepID=A0A182NQG5_9DIPT
MTVETKSELPVSRSSSATNDELVEGGVSVAEVKHQQPEAPAQLPQYVYVAMERVARDEGFTAGLYTLDIEDGSSKGDGFIGELFRAFLSEGPRREVYLCKIPPRNEARRKQCGTMEIFEREVLMYSQLLPLMFAYQEEKGISHEEGFFNVPKCFYAHYDATKEEAIIVMEDLRENDYHMFDRYKPLNYEHVRLVMEQLGRYNAVSLAMKRDRSPEEFAPFQLGDPMNEMPASENPIIIMLQQTALDAMATLEPHEIKERSKMQKLLDNMLPDIERFGNRDLAEPYAVLGHGDCWINNMMYQYEVKGAPKKVVLFDWQTARYVSPILDLAYYMLCCTEEEFRRKHYDEMMNVYYSSLATLLERLGHDPQQVFPRTAFLRQLRQYGRFGLLMATFLVPMLCTRNEDLPDMDETAQMFVETENVDIAIYTKNANQSAYRKRMSAVIRDTSQNRCTQWLKMVVETNTDTGVELSGPVEQPVVTSTETAEDVKVPEPQHTSQECSEEEAQVASAPQEEINVPEQQHIEEDCRQEETEEENASQGEKLLEAEHQHCDPPKEDTYTTESPVMVENSVEAEPSEASTAVEERSLPVQEDVPVESVAGAETAAPVPAPASAAGTELPQYMYKAMEQVGSEQGFTPGQFKIEFDVGSNKGDGFVGLMFKAFLTEGARREVYLCKIPPLNEARRKQFQTMTIFGRETLAYTKFLPLIFAYQKEKGVGREDGFFNTPKCYYAACDESSEESVIIMEDLRLQDYRMWNKMLPVNYEHARLTMQSLGRLHAVSLALKRDRPEEFEHLKVPDPMEVMMPEGSPFEAMMKQMLADAVETLEPHETKERCKLQKLIENLRQEMAACSKSDTAEPHAVLGHGDCWVNNFMFQYKNGAPDKVVLLDWQITRYVSPALDLAYFIFCCTDGEFRRLHYDEMMSIYYSSLATLLEKLGHDPQQVFPRTALVRQMRRFGRFGVLMAVFLVPMMCTRNEDLPDMDEAAEKFRDTNEMDPSFMKLNSNVNAYRERMSAVIRDTVRYVSQPRTRTCCHFHPLPNSSLTKRMKSALTIPEYVKEALASVAQKLGFTGGQHSVDYDFRPTEDARSVVSVFYRVTFREEPREVTVLCKVPPPEADDTVLALFEREVFVYGKLLPAFEQFQRSRQEALVKAGTTVEHEESVAFGPLCYHAHCDVKKGEGIIVLENVQSRGFTNRHKFQPMDYDHARLAMMQLGRFHAISLALKKQQPELFEQYRYMGDVTGERVLTMDGFEEAMDQAFESASATLNPGDVGRREKLARLRGCFAEELQNISDTALSEPFCVVCHGDYAGDNMMFSYNGGFPNRMILLDWQLAKYGSPALDFVHTVFLSTDESFRRNHYDNMLQTYHNALMSHLERLGDDSATEWFPLTVLMRLTKLQARQALLLGMLHIPLTVASEEAAAAEEGETNEEREDSSSVQISDTSDAKYQTRMVGLLKDVFRLGFL